MVFSLLVLQRVISILFRFPPVFSCFLRLRYSIRIVEMELCLSVEVDLRHLYDNVVLESHQVIILARLESCDGRRLSNAGVGHGRRVRHVGVPKLAGLP